MMFKMDIGKLYQIGLVALQLVEQEFKLCKESASHQKMEVRNVKEKKLLQGIYLLFFRECN